MKRNIERFQAISLELSEICQSTRRGTVEGVEFDLRHALLDPTKWVMGTIGIHLDHYKIPNAPFCWYPWYGNFDGKALQREATKEAARIVRIAKMRGKPIADAKAKKAFVDSYVKKRSPEHFLNAGDKLIIESVVDNAIGDEFYHPDDAKTRSAYLRIIRSDGSHENVTTPLRFEGVTALLQRGIDGNFFDKLCHRICLHFSVKSLNEINVDARHGPDKMPEPKEQFVRRAVLRAHQINERSFELRRIANSIPFEHPSYVEASRAWASVNDGVLLGYLWAKVEEEITTKPLATSARVRSTREAEGGRKGAEKRQQKRAAWEAVVKKATPEIREKNPRISQDEVAERIKARCKESGTWLPGHSSITGFLSTIWAETSPATRRS
jgi:hypothetical protein